jgi:hypothetical protein
MTSLTSKIRLIALALATATFTTALVAGASARPAQALRVEPVSIHKVAPAARASGGHLPTPVAATTMSRVHPADEQECVTLKDGSKVLCTPGPTAQKVITFLGGLL